MPGVRAALAARRARGEDPLRRARRSRPSPPRRPSRPTTPSPRSVVAYDRAPLRRRHRRGAQARRSPRLRGQGRDEGLRRRRRVPREEPRPQRQRPRAPLERQGRRRGGVPQGRRGRRGHLRDAGPDAHALETHGLVARWDGEELTVWASTQGIFDHARRARRDAQDPGLQGPRDHRVHGRRLRSEVRPPRRGPGRREAREGGRRPGQALPRPQGGAARHRQPPLLGPDRQGGRDEGRQADGPAADRLRQRRHQRRHRHLRPHQERLRLREPQGRRVRRLHQRRPVDRHARARAPPGRLRARGDDGRARPGDRHGSPGVPHEERPLGGPPRGVPDRRREDRLEGPRRAPADVGPVDPPGRRRRRGRLVQHRRHRPAGDRHDPPRRLGRGRARRAGPRHRLADDDRHRRGRGARAAAREGLRVDGRHAAALRAGLGRLDDDAVERSDDPPGGLPGQARARPRARAANGRSRPNP